MIAGMATGTVWDNANWQRQEFVSLVGRFVAAVHTPRVREAVGAALLEQLVLQIQQTLARLDNEFSLVVMGDFKRGKSTLVNALLEQPLVPTDVAPATMTINEIQYGPEVTVTAHFHDGRQASLEVAELAANRLVSLLMQSVDKELPAILGSINRATLQEVLAQAFNEEELNDLGFALGLSHADWSGRVHRARVRELILYMERRGRLRELIKEGYALRQSAFEEAVRLRPPPHRQLPQLEKLRQEVSHVAITAPISFLQGIRLVDTPGVSDLLSLFDNQVQGYMAKADAVIYVLSVRYPLSQGEREFLRRALQPRDFAKLFFVVNRIDEASEENVARFLNHVQGQLYQLFPDAPLFGLSALDEQCRLSGEERPAPARAAALAEAFAQFRGGLRQTVFLNRDLMQLERTIVRMEQLLAEFETSLRNVEQAMEADQQQLGQTIAQLEDENSALNQQMRAYRQQVQTELATVADQAVGWLEAFIDRLEQEMIPSIGRVKLADIHRFFHFFLADALSDAMHQCLDAQRPFIIDLVHRIRQAMLGDIRPQAPEPAAGEAAGAPEEAQGGEEAAWRNIDVFDELAEQSAVAIASFANELTGAVSSYLSERQALSEARLLATYQDALREAVPRLRDAVKVEVRSLYDHLCRRITAQLDAAYRQEAGEALAIMRHARTLQQGDQTGALVDTGILQHTLKTTGDTRRALSHLKEQLWFSDQVPA